MTEIYLAVRDRLFSAIDRGELEDFSKDNCETVLARTMQRMRLDFGLPAFGLVLNEPDPEALIDEWKGS